jgi:predicted ATPase
VKGTHLGILKTWFCDHGFLSSFSGYRLLGSWSIRREDAAAPPVGRQQLRISGEAPATYFPAIVTRLVGRSDAVLLRQDPDPSTLAEDCYDQVAELAREQRALFWELRVALSLARLRVSQSRPNDARQILAPVYDRFTEGFGTADLRAARAMLDALPLA